VVHLNEGHAAFAALELAREEVERGASFASALESTRARIVFTTHTPVAAGNEEYTAREMLETVEGFVKQLGLEPEAVLALGRRHPASREGFGLTQLALRTSRAANGVSRLHGRVARGMWQGLWPGRAVDEVPIGHVTNGVHLPTWMAPALRGLLARHLGADFERRAEEPALWAKVDEIPDEELWALRGELRGALVRHVQDKSVADRLSRGGVTRHYAEAAARSFDPNVLTLGFARRVAAYKRLHLLAHDAERALRLLEGPTPVQIVIAGKAHPSDREAKGLVRQLFPLTEHTWVPRRVSFLEDYDLAMAAHLVRGCDVWINVPRPPLEASGTSGMKSALNGGLHLSVLDGWWAEAYEPGVGWAIEGGAGEGAPPEAQDAADAAALYDLLEREVVPCFYERDAGGVPRRWIARVRRSLRALGPRYNAGRMMGEYVEKAYRRG
jgi:starch phosphorylase